MLMFNEAFLQVFQAQTGLKIHSVPVTEQATGKPVIATVKVQI
jgi:hypothetical protein